MVYKAEVPILSKKNAMEHQWESSNLDIIITCNLSDKYPILMIGGCPLIFGY